MTSSRWRRWSGLAGPSIITVATIATAVLGSVTGDFNSAWYRALRKPRWQPPGAAIGAVWTVLYTLTTIAGSILWRRRDPLLWGLFVAQYALNAAFTPLLTKRRSITLAALDSGALAATVTALVLRAAPVKPRAAALLAPYALWASFATLLSVRLRQLNPNV